VPSRHDARDARVTGIGGGHGASAAAARRLSPDRVATLVPCHLAPPDPALLLALVAAVGGVLVVDDGMPRHAAAELREVARRCGAAVLRMGRNLGKGHALAGGLERLMSSPRPRFGGCRSPLPRLHSAPTGRGAGRPLGRRSAAAPERDPARPAGGTSRHGAAGPPRPARHPADPQSAVRRADALRARLADGLDSSDFRPGSLTAADLSRALRGAAAGG
jgi:hypothetical protein